LALEIVPATRAHAERIELRPGDAREVAALGKSKVEALCASMERSLWTDAYLVDGEVAAILGFGLTALVGGEATLWMLSGTPVDRHRKLFLRLTRQRLAEVRREWPVLVDYVHADYAGAIRWLRWLGFTIEPPVPYGPFGAPFCRASIGEH
jgi:ribosomal protein S18 acetylase RimI-like enzyme